jgi:hypothetical protein
MKTIKLALICAACMPFAAFADDIRDEQAVAENSDNDPLREYFEARDDLPQTDKSLIAQSTDGTDPAAGAAGATPGAGAKPTAKKTKKKKSADGTSPESATSGHGDQENGAPYFAEVGMGLWYSSESTTQKYTNESHKTAITDLALDVKYQMIFGSFEVGPKIIFGSNTKKVTTDTTTTTKTSSLGLGLGFTFNMGNIHTSKLVPFVALDVDRMSSSSSVATEGVDGESKSTDTDTRPSLSVGANIFMGGHVALKPLLQYQMIMGGEHKEEETGTDAVVASVTGSKLRLGMGIATFF